MKYICGSNVIGQCADWERECISFDEAKRTMLYKLDADLWCLTHSDDPEFDTDGIPESYDEATISFLRLYSYELLDDGDEFGTDVYEGEKQRRCYWIRRIG